MKLKYLIIAVLIAFFTLFSILFTKNFFSKNDENKIKSNNLSDISKHYSKYVVTTKETGLYKKNKNDYKKVGKINKDVKLILSDSSNTKEKYYQIDGLEYYVSNKDIKAIKKFINDERYKKYVPFNKNVKTNSSVAFYDENDNYIYSIDETLEFKILVMEEDKYGVEYNNRLVYIKNDSVESVYDYGNGMTNRDKIRTLTYHFLYNPEKSECKEDICHTLEQFEAELKYLNENDYFTMKLNELEMYLDGKINIPEKSIVLTIDDGTVFDLDAIKLLEKYKVNLTMFVVTSFVSNISDLKSDYLDLESHTHNMHNQYECPGYGMQGGGILCLPEEQVLSDLKTSQDILGGSTYFAYPFFDVNDRAIKLLKQAGFKLAFIGEYDTKGYSYKDRTDHYKLRRLSIFNDTNLDEFIKYLN